MGRGPEGGVIILGMKYFQSRKSRLCIAVVATFVFAVLFAAVVAGQANQVATFEGELRELW